MVRDILQKISELIERHNDALRIALHDRENKMQLYEVHANQQLRTALSGGENELWVYLVSNDLWGGAGSVADQALLELPDARRQLDGLMIDLGREQMSLGRVNVRTQMWVTAFEKWRTEGIR